ncbi:hypothetical protein OH76DRAFT_341557 [Lentinus brumalis]|uniref:DNA recombination and repair protein Rad51-like C-terminal domain-containing protein n=1 Tax=Lentinus brumalis TaxID=2498619 RepID=A0A371DET3_9APHY|nr:hypothetical protein OH76DRAFT_341557 [Polyporus brumalis]
MTPGESEPSVHCSCPSSRPSLTFFHLTTSMVRRAPSQSVPAPSRPSSPPGDDVDESPFFDTVDELQQHGINVQDILKLKAAAINTVSGVNMTTRRHMLKIKGMSEAKVEKIKAGVHLFTLKFRSADVALPGGRAQNIGESQAERRI